jgi:hypothetical protein
MCTGKYYNIYITGFFMVAMLWMSVSLSVTVQEDPDAPVRVINAYLESLVSGDTQQLVLLLDGKLKNDNKQLILNPETYSQFLREHYQGVNTVIEDVSREDTRARARVRFEFPVGDTMLIEFILLQREGQWKVVDEIY